MESQEGKCVSCGLLTKRTAPHYSGLAYHEVRPGERDRGDIFFFPDSNNRLVCCMPVCYAGAAPLAQEAMGDPIERPDNEMWSRQCGEWQQGCIATLLKDRQCPSWVEYIEGLSPEWHLEMNQMSLLEKAREDWARQLEQDRRTWESNFQVQLEQGRREWQERFQEQSSRFGTQLAIFGAFLAVVGLSLTAMGLTCDSLFLKLFTCLYKFAGCGKP